MRVFRDHLKETLGQSSKWIILALAPFLIPLFASLIYGALALVTLPVFLLLPPVSEQVLKWVSGIQLAIGVVLSIMSVVWMYRNSA